MFMKKLRDFLIDCVFGALTVGFCLFGYWTFLDTYPAAIINFDRFENPIVAAGEDLSFISAVDILRPCELDVRRWIYSTEDDKDPILASTQTIILNQEDVGNTLEIKRTFQVPKSLKPGTYYLYIEGDTKCNIIQNKWPMHYKLKKHPFEVK